MCTLRRCKRTAYDVAWRQPRCDLFDVGYVFDDAPSFAVAPLFHTAALETATFKRLAPSFTHANVALLSLQPITRDSVSYLESVPEEERMEARGIDTSCKRHFE